MAEWRLATGWSSDELSSRLEGIEHLPRNSPILEGGLTRERGFAYHHSAAVIAREQPGAPIPGGPFERAIRLVAEYEFSDPRIVTCHYDPRRPLLGRRMLLELKVLALRYLAGVVVSAVHRDEDSFGFRYDTLVGHIESGAEWFLLEKDRASGDVRFRIEAAWRAGDFPNVWSRMGFELLGRRYQRAWHRLAYARLRTLLASGDLPPLPSADRMIHEGRGLPLPNVHAFASADKQSTGMEDERDHT